MKHLPSYYIFWSPQQTNKRGKANISNPYFTKEQTDNDRDGSLLTIIHSSIPFSDSFLVSCPSKRLLPSLLGRLVWPYYQALPLSCKLKFCERFLGSLKRKDEPFLYSTFPFIYFSKAEMWWLVLGSHYEDKGLLILIGGAVSSGP